MEKYFDQIKKCQLFSNIAEADLKSLLNCLSSRFHSFEKGEFIFREDSVAESVGVTLVGRVHIIHEDYWGNRTILAQIAEHELFGEAFSCAEAERLPVSAIADEKSEIMLIDYRKIITTCPSACSFHTQLIKNMLKLIAKKNMMLTQKIQLISKRTTREKLLQYFSLQAKLLNTKEFEIPFDRQQLADYLCVDRSAMSRELGAMQKEGLLHFAKNRFTILV